MDKRVLTNNWSVKADPFYAMHKRTGYSLENICKLSPAEAVEAVFGTEVARAIAPDGEIAGLGLLQKTLFSAWCYMYLRQANGSIRLPISFGEEFYLLGDQTMSSAITTAGYLLRNVGISLEGDQVCKDAWKSFTQILGAGDARRENIGALAEAHGVSIVAAKHAIVSACISQLTEKKVFTYPSCERLIREVVGEVNANLVYLDPNWIRFGDFLATAQDVAVVLDFLSTVTKEIEVKADGDGDGFRFWISGTEFHCTNNDGIFHVERNRRLQGMLLVNASTGKHNSVPVSAEDVSLVNSYGTFLYALLYGAPAYLAKKVPAWDEFVNKILIKGEEYPLTAEDEVGPADGDRKFYERYVTVTRPAPTELPFQFIKLDDSVLVAHNQTIFMTTGVSATSEVRPRLPKNSSVDRTVLETFNLVRMPNGRFIDGRRSCIQLRHTTNPRKYAEQMFLYLAGTDNLSAAEHYARKSVDVPADVDIWEYLGQNLVVGLSSKLAKLIKRTAMDAAVVAQLVDGKGRGFKRFGQPKESENCWLVESVVSAHAIWPAGMACYWGAEPEMIVDHTESHQLPYSGKVDETTLIQVYTNYVNEVILEDGWYKATFSRPIPIDKGGLVGYVNITTNGVQYPFAVTTRIAEAQLVAIEWQKRRGYGDLSTVFVKVRTITVESEIKGRNNVKAMLTRYDRRCLALNEDISARAIFFKDTNKWLDLIAQITDVAACTAIQNQDAEGLELIRSANAAAGVNHCEYLEWSPVLSVVGVYQPLINWFEEKFGRAVWFKWEDPTGEWTTVLRLMYTKHDSPNEAERGEPIDGWQFVSRDKVADQLPENASNVLALADGPETDIHTNIILIYQVGGVEYFVQRAFSFAGTSDTGPVWQPVKAELSSVRAAVGKTPLMSGVARSIELADPEYTTRLTADGLDGVKRAATIVRMAKGNANGPNTIVLGTPDAKSILCTDELRDLVMNPLTQRNLVSHLAEKFEDVTFIAPTPSGKFSLHLPTIATQDGSNNLSSSVTMAGLTAQLMSRAILGEDFTSEVFCAIARSLNGAIRNLARSEALAKAPAYCRTGVIAKCKSIPGIGIGEVWVRMSERSNSVYQTMRSVYGPDVDGRKVMLSRAPMTTPAIMKVRVINPRHSMADCIEPDSVYLSPMGQMLNGGDFDGDGVTLTDASDSSLPVTNLNDIINNVVARTGSDQLNPGASYWGDYFEILSTKAVASKRAVGKKNLSLLNSKDRKALPTMLEGSSTMFEEAINWSHRVFLTSDLYLSMVWSLETDLVKKFPSWKPAAFTRNKSLVLLLAELYEIPLGGLDWGAYDAIMKRLVPIIRDLRTSYNGAQVEEFARDLADAGIRHSAQDIFKAALQAAECRKFSQDKVPSIASAIHGTTPEGFLTAAAEIAALISKGDFSHEVPLHRKMADEVKEWLEKHDADGVLRKKSTVLTQIQNYLEVMKPAFEG